MHPSRRSHFVALAAAVALFAGACTGVGGSTAALVNGEAIHESGVEKHVEARLAGLPLGDAPVAQRAQRIRELQNRVLGELILFTIIEQAAEARGVTATAEEVQAQWDQRLAAQGGEEALRDAIAAAGLTEEEARAQLAAEVKLNKLLTLLSGADPVTEEEVRELYEQRADEWEQADVSHILVDTEAQAEDLIAQLEEGASFEELAEEFSIDPGSAPRGGNLGAFPRGRYVAEFDQAVWAADAGEIVGPVETQFGWHVIRVNEFVNTTFDEVAASLRDELERARTQDAAEVVFRELLREADVEIAASFGQWDPAAGGVVATDLLDRVPAVTGAADDS